MHEQCVMVSEPLVIPHGNTTHCLKLNPDQVHANVTGSPVALLSFPPIPTQPCINPWTTPGSSRPTVLAELTYAGPADRPLLMT